MWVGVTGTYQDMHDTRRGGEGREREGRRRWWWWWWCIGVDDGIQSSAADTVIM